MKSFAQTIVRSNNKRCFRPSTSKSFDRTWDLMQFIAGQIRGPKLIFALIQIE